MLVTDLLWYSGIPNFMLIDLMFQSLQILKTAIFDKECEPCILTDADYVMYSLVYAP